MKSFSLLISLILFFSINVFSNQFWAKSMGGTYDEYASSFAVDAAGNTYSVGYFKDTADFDPGPGKFILYSHGYTTTLAADIYITKLDANGNFVWAKNIGGNSGDYGWGIAIDNSGNLIICGNFFGTVDFDPGPATQNLTSLGGWDMFVLKLDASGNFIWVKQMGGTSYESGSAVTTDKWNNIYVTGSFSGKTDFDPGIDTFYLNVSGLGDGFMLKLNASGNFRWALKLGGTDDDAGLLIKTDVNGNVFCSGSYNNSGNFGPVILNSNGKKDNFILKADTAGTILWVKSFGGAMDDFCEGIAIDALGNLYATGAFNGTIDFDPGTATFNLTSTDWDIFVLKLNAAGNFVWAGAMGGSITDEGASITLDAANNIYITGYFQGANADFDPGTGKKYLSVVNEGDMYMVKLNASGNFIWAVSIGGPTFEYGKQIATDAAGNIYVMGMYKGTCDFDYGTGQLNLTSLNGSWDMFIYKTNQTGVGLENKGVGLQENKLSVHPNPGKDIFQVEMQDVVKEKLTIMVFDNMGRIIYEDKMMDLFQNNYILDFKNEENGVYFVKVLGENYSAATSFVIQH